MQDTGPLVCWHFPNLRCCLDRFQAVALCDASREPPALWKITHLLVLSLILCQTYFMRKNLHISICIVS